MSNDQISKTLEPLGYRVRKQMEAAREMGLTPSDLRALYDHNPERYRDLLTAMGVLPNHHLPEWLVNVAMRTLWACAWADYIERLNDTDAVEEADGQRDKYLHLAGEIPNMSGMEIFSIMDDFEGHPAEADLRHIADEFFRRMAKAYRFETALERAKGTPGASNLPDAFCDRFMQVADGDEEGLAHYLVMEAMGHGVSWSDDHEPHGLPLPPIGSGDCWLEYAEHEEDGVMTLRTVWHYECM